jgi:hypothetical protein
MMKSLKLWFGKTLALAGILAGVGTLASSGSAAVPNGITQQGRLLDSDGEPVTGELTFVFTIYDNPELSAEENILWTETQSITLDDGYFSVRLGDGGSNPFPETLFDGSARYLGVKVGSDDEMSPRQHIASTPYARVAGLAHEALRAEEASLADRATVATNVDGAITPASVTVGGVAVIDSNGKVPASSIKGFATLFSRVQALGSNGGSSTATASCSANHVATGGGCGITAATGTVVVKVNEPSMSGATPVGWQCTCQDADVDNTVTCTVEATAVCASAPTN